MAMATAMTLQEDAEHNFQLSWRNPPSIYNPPPLSSDAPKWSYAREYFMTREPPPGFGIIQRARELAYGFVIPKRDKYSPELPEDEELDEFLFDSLDELREYDVESINLANLIHSGGYLCEFLSGSLSNKHACTRAKAAELITSMVQYHPTSQQLIIEGNGLQLLLHNFTTDIDTTSRTKTLGAISSLIRNNESGNTVSGITVFLQENGYEALTNALKSLKSGTVLKGEIVNLIRYLGGERSLYSEELNLKFGDDSEVQEAIKGGNSGRLGKNYDKPKQDNSKKRSSTSSKRMKLD